MGAWSKRVRGSGCSTTGSWSESLPGWTERPRGYSVQCRRISDASDRRSPRHEVSGHGRAPIRPRSPGMSARAARPSLRGRGGRSHCSSAPASPPQVRGIMAGSSRSPEGCPDAVPPTRSMDAASLAATPLENPNRTSSRCPGHSEPGRCAFCGVRFPLDESDGVFVVSCPCGPTSRPPCELDGIPARRAP